MLAKFFLLVLILVVISKNQEPEHTPFNPVQTENVFSLQQTTPLPIRIFFNTSLLFPDADPLRTCYTVGQEVIRGIPPTNTTMCDTTTGIRLDCIAICTIVDLMANPAAGTRLVSYLNVAKTKLESMISVEPIATLQGTISSCGNTRLYGIQDMTGHDVNNGVSGVDLYIYVTARPQYASDGFTTSAECQADGTGRPLIAHLNLNPGSHFSNPTTGHNYVLHELIHILGFRFSKIASLPGRTGQVNYLTRTLGGDSQVIRFVNMPNTLAEVQSQFNCADVRGAEFEDADDHTDHLEKRLFFNEIMTGDFSTGAGEGPVLSRITLGILDDLGFYTVDLTKGEQLVYGRGLGCTFYNERCETWPTIKNLDGLFCDIVGGDDGNHCTYDHFSKGTCDLSFFTTPIRPLDQHFIDPTKGGQVGETELRNYCTMFRTSESSDCRVAKTGDFINTGETFGNRSRCFRSNSFLRGSSLGKAPTLSRCFEHACVNGTSLYIKVGSRWSKCEGNTDLKTIPYYEGTLYCPTVSSLCAKGETSPWVTDEITNPVKNVEPDPFVGLRLMLQYLPPYIWTIIALALLATLIFAIIYSTWAIIKKAYDKRKKKKRKGVSRGEDGIEIVDVVEQTREVLREEAKSLSKEKWKRQQQKRIDKGEATIDDLDNDNPDSDK